MAPTDSAATKSGRLQFEHNTRTTKVTNLHRMLKPRTLLSLALFPLIASAANWSEGSKIHTLPDSQLTEISTWESSTQLPERRWLGSGF